jgi:glyoxalase-like protein
MPSIADDQRPAAGTINLDHVAHFVPDAEAARVALARAGFTLTPFSHQSHRLEPDGPLLPAGSGNRCVMLNAGYLEFLTPTADTPIAGQLRAAIDRYVGVHLIAFGTANPDADHARLSREGFQPQTPIALQRQIETPHGYDTARFTVVRVPPGTMAEGRIQYCAHHTPELVWQARWLQHANGAQRLTGVILCVEDVDDALRRYARFTGRTPNLAESRIDTARGTLLFLTRDRCASMFNIEAPCLPWIAGYSVACQHLARAAELLQNNGLGPRRLSEGRFFVQLPPAVGGLAVLEEDGSAPLVFNR